MVTDDIHLFNEKLREWEDYYKYHRPRGIGRPTSLRAIVAKANANRGIRFFGGAFKIAELIFELPLGPVKRSAFGQWNRSPDRSEGSSR